MIFYGIEDVVGIWDGCVFVMFSIEKRMRRGKSSKYFLGDKFGPVAMSGLALVGFRADPICEHSNKIHLGPSHSRVGSAVQSVSIPCYI